MANSNTGPGPTDVSLTTDATKPTAVCRPLTATVTATETVLLPPRSARSTRYHQPTAPDALRPACEGFVAAGTSVHREVAVDYLGLRPCGLCWPEVGR